eukprot:5104246-Alexandrium_andersonii.AAC.1
MSASLVGSEMCIRDRETTREVRPIQCTRPPARKPGGSDFNRFGTADRACLLYTSDAADDM